MLWTGVAVVVAIFVIAGAFLLTQTKTANPDATPLAPGILTPTNVPANGQTLGAVSAPVTLDLYSDFRCTACFGFYSEIEPKIFSDFVVPGKLRIVYHDVLQIDGIDAQNGVITTASRDAANAGLCAADEGKFWYYHDWLFANQDPNENPSAYSIDKLIAIAKAAGIDNATFESCVRNGSHNNTVAAEASAKPAAVTGTPTIYVAGKLVTSAKGTQYTPTYDEIAAAINAAIGASASPSAGPSASASPS